MTAGTGPPSHRGSEPDGPPALVPRLTPRLDPVVAAVMARADLLHQWIDTWGSPLHLVFPEVFEANLARIRGVLDRAPVTSRIFYAHKANQARAFVEAAARAGIGVDVASAGELASALSAGLTLDRIEGTGPKGPALVEALADVGAVVNVDNRTELALLADWARRHDRRDVPVLARLSGFAADGDAPSAHRVSRFGVPPDQWSALIGDLVEHRGHLRFLGLSFHLDSSDARDRVTAVQGCLRLLERAWAAGLEPNVIDLGGGLRQVHLADPDDYGRYTTALRRGLTGQGPALTWNGATLGYRPEEGAVRGVPVVHRYANTEGPEATLERWLALPLPDHGHRRLDDVLADNLLEVWIEPGKALVDQAGLTLCRVELVTTASDGSRLALLDLSRDKVSPADQEVFVDPVLVAPPGPATSGSDVPGPEAEAGPAAVFLAGNLCLERDMVTNRLVAFDRWPRAGDLLAFTNTAAYQMDLSASDALMQPRPRVVRVDRHPDAGGGSGLADHVTARPDRS